MAEGACVLFHERRQASSEPPCAACLLGAYQTDLAAAITFFQGCTPQVAISASYASHTFTATPTGYNGAPGFCGFASSTLLFTGGTITLDGAGLTNPVFVFQVGSALNVTTAATTISLINGATAANVVWVVGTSATFDAHDHVWAGQILAVASITLNSATNMTLAGRALANTGHVTVSNNTSITAPSSAGVIAAGDVVIYDANGNVMSSGILLSSLGGAAGVLTFNGRNGSVLPASGDYTVAQVTGAAPLASPALTGTPTAPTAAALDNSTKIATTAYADAAVAVETSRATTAEGLLVPKTTTVNGHALSSNVTVAFADLGGSLAVSQINSKQGNGNAVQLTNTGATTSGDVVTYDGNSNVVDSGTLLSSLATTASVALKANSASPTFTGTVTLPAAVNGPGSQLTITESVGGVLISGSAVNRGVNVNTSLATDGVVLQDNTAANSVIVSATAGGILLETSGGGHVAVSGGDLSIAVNHIVGNTDIAGTVTITGATSQAVAFTTAYGSTPKAVSLTPLGDTTTVGPYWVTALSATGFTANIHTSGTMSFYYQVIG